MRQIYFIKIPWHIIWVMTLLEGITLPLLFVFKHGDITIIELKSVLNGFIVGSIGSILLFCVINLIIRYIRVKVANEQILNISPWWVIGMWGGLILGLLFQLENSMFSVLNVFNLNHTIISVIVAFSATWATVIIILAMYNHTKFARIHILTMKGSHLIVNFTSLSIATVAALYEAIAFPVIWYVYYLTQSALLGGLCGGFMGGVVVYIICRFLSMVKIGMTMVLGSSK